MGAALQSMPSADKAEIRMVCKAFMRRFNSLPPHDFFRDGTVYGCGSTEHGQLPYLRYSQDGSSDGVEGASMSAAELENIPARNEITIPTRLRLPVRQACPHLMSPCSAPTTVYMPGCGLMCSRLLSP